MKILSARFRFVVIGAIVVVAVVSCCTIPIPLITDTKSVITAAGSYIELGHQLRAEVPERTYVEWKDQAKFDKALEKVRGNNGEYCLCVLLTAGDKPHPYDAYNKCPRRYDCPRGNIRTVKVTKSKAAKNIAVGESAVNDPNVTYRILSSSPGDIIAVLDALK
jgi:hypothetical protein